MNRAIAFRYWSKSVPLFYVSGLRGPVSDWEYTTDVEKAIPLSPYWQRRFAADCRAVGVSASFVPVAVSGLSNPEK